MEGENSRASVSAVDDWAIAAHGRVERPLDLARIAHRLVLVDEVVVLLGDEAVLTVIVVRLQGEEGGLALLHTVDHLRARVSRDSTT